MVLAVNAGGRDRQGDGLYGMATGAQSSHDCSSCLKHFIFGWRLPFSYLVGHEFNSNLTVSPSVQRVVRASRGLNPNDSEYIVPTVGWALMQGPARVRPAADRPASCQAGQPLSADPLTLSQDSVPPNWCCSGRWWWLIIYSLCAPASPRCLPSIVFALRIAARTPRPHTHSEIRSPQPAQLFVHHIRLGHTSVSATLHSLQTPPAFHSTSVDSPGRLTSSW